MEDLELAQQAARVGGAIVAAGFGNIQQTDFKSRNDPVTDVDHASEQAIVDLLRSERPTDSIIGEEGTERGSGEGRTWIIDPLDGTVNFVHGLPQVSVAIGLFDGDEPLVGAVYDPIADEMFSAATGQGATLNGNPLTVSTCDDPAQALAVTGFPYDHHVYADAYVDVAREMIRVVRGMRRLGSAALDICYVAAGRIDVGWEFNLKPWDLAAAMVVLLEAGGSMTQPDGSIMTPRSKHYVSSNTLLHEFVRTIVFDNFPEHLKL